VRFFTSWKLWLPMLFVSLLLIAAAILWPAYRRMLALEFIDGDRGSYTLGEPRWPWLAEKLGPLGRGLHSVEQVQMHRPITLDEFRLLSALNDATSVKITPREFTSEWIDSTETFSHLRQLNIFCDLSIDDFEQLLSRVPRLEFLRCRQIINGNVLSAANVAGGGSHLRSLAISECKPSLTVEGFPALEKLRLGDVTDANVTVRRLPALREISISYANEGTTLTLDAPLQKLSYDRLETPQLVVPAGVETLSILNVDRCTITGGDDLTALKISESCDITVADMPALKSIVFATSTGGDFTLRNLPQLEHLMLMTKENHVSPTLQLDGVDNLRAIDAPWWRTDDAHVAALCELPRLEHLVISRATIDAETIELLQEVETLRLLRLPRRVTSAPEREMDFVQLRQRFSQPGIRIHGPHIPMVESEQFWTPPE
jgi:hypothetical protein